MAGLIMPSLGELFNWLSGVRLQWPALLLLLPLPMLLRILMPVTDEQSMAIRTPQFDTLKASIASTGAAGSRLRASAMLVLMLGLWAALLIAAARPIWYGQPEAVPTQGRDLMLAVDISESMRVDDMTLQGKAVTRLASVKQVVADFIKQRNSDRIGLILFGHQSFVQAPLTFDHKTVNIQLREAMAGFAGSSTAIGDVLGLAVKTLRDRQADSRVLILLTDGANTAGSDPRRAANIAAEANIRIHTIGIGASGRFVGNPSGETRWLDTTEELDTDTLRTIAQVTGGQYFRAEDAAQMAAVYRAIDTLEPSPEPQTFHPERSLFHWPLGLAILLGALVTVMRARMAAD